MIIFFRKKDNLDNVEIEFTSGKNEFLLSSVNNKDANDKNKYKKIL
jgi:hypothetical protein